MRTTALMLGIVVIAVGCDKTGGKPPAAVEPVLNLDSTPDLLFHVFGVRSEAQQQMMPIAAIRGNEIIAINLLPTGWRELDAKYFRANAVYPVFRDGLQTGTVTVTRGMWSGDPLYSLPGCKSVIPMASVTLSDTVKAFTVDQFGTTRTAEVRVRGKTLPADSVRAIAKRMGYAAGRTVDLDSLALDSLDFRAAAIETHARTRPTIVASYIDPRGGDEKMGRGNTADVLVIADDDGTGYRPTFTHAVNGDASRAEYRAYLDHLDITGSGVDQILLEGWHFGSEAALHVLVWRAGTWRDVFVGRSSWCLDPPRKR
jgi:hypothetical protein